MDNQYHSTTTPNGKENMFRAIVEMVYNSIVENGPDYVAINLQYFRNFRELPNLKNPKKFTEKLAWRKLYQRDPQFSVFSDKVAAKKEIAKLIGAQHIIETLWVGINPEEIPLDNLKPPFVIKVNHSSGGHIFIRTTADIDRHTILETMRKQLCRPGLLLQFGCRGQRRGAQVRPQVGRH